MTVSVAGRLSELHKDGKTSLLGNLLVATRSAEIS
jgi:hypothetical protein